jgi:hypothetical protein
MPNNGCLTSKFLISQTTVDVLSHERIYQLLLLMRYFSLNLHNQLYQAAYVNAEKLSACRLKGAGSFLRHKIEMLVKRKEIALIGIPKSRADIRCQFHCKIRVSTQNYDASLLICSLRYLSRPTCLMSSCWVSIQSICSSTSFTMSSSRCRVV